MRRQGLLDRIAQRGGAFTLAAAAKGFGAGTPDGVAILAVEQFDAHHHDFFGIAAHQRRAAPHAVVVAIPTMTVLAAVVFGDLAPAVLQTQLGADLEVAGFTGAMWAQAALVEGIAEGFLHLLGAGPGPARRQGVPAPGEVAAEVG